MGGFWCASAASRETRAGGGGLGSAQDPSYPVWTRLTRLPVYPSYPSYPSTRLTRLTRLAPVLHPSCWHYPSTGLPRLLCCSSKVITAHMWLGTHARDHSWSPLVGRLLWAVPGQPPNIVKVRDATHNRAARRIQCGAALGARRPIRAVRVSACPVPCASNLRYLLVLGSYSGPTRTT